MDGRILAHSLVSLKGTELRMVYALLHKTNIGHLVSTKTKEVFSREESDHFTKHLESEVRKLEGEEDAVLQVDLFLEMTKLLKLRGTKYTLQKEIEDQCSLIVNHVYDQFLKEDKHFRSFVENEAESSKLQQMIKFQMNKIFKELDGSFEDFSIQDQTKFAEQVNEYIHTLPQEQQIKIKEKLGVNDLSDEMVRKAIATSGTSIVFAIIVEISGFAFYTTATSLLASFAGLLGLTIPFGVYTTLTSTIAVLANPLFIVPLLLGGGAFLVNHQNKSLKKKLLPIIVMQVTLPYMSQEGDSVPFNDFIDEWSWRFQKYQNLNRKLGDVHAYIEANQNHIRQAELKIQKLTSEKTAELNRISVDKPRIYSALQSVNLNELEINPEFDKHRNEYNKLSNKIYSLESSKQTIKNDTSLFNKVGNTLSNFTTSIDIKKEEKKLNECMNQMVEDVLNSNSSFMSDERKRIQLGYKQVHYLKTVIGDESERKNQLELDLKKKKQNKANIKREIKSLQDENYGLEDLGCSANKIKALAGKD